ncbi:BlaI/MecI/CopY family transcriptional regulator [Streptomyces sp. NRRL B-24720]|uniref:BlaI/MecI/CopY family transcriptional regulator n=1 Tax=Streptomyces sp. NRRL B-24720 TaxID=1476876 RepID=UPI002D21829A|nr:BlaI/MecI/CopY family transcriptional regulator [Streptomyces sp. NRRL B-24720]
MTLPLSVSSSCAGTHQRGNRGAAGAVGCSAARPLRAGEHAGGARRRERGRRGGHHGRTDRTASGHRRTPAEQAEESEPRSATEISAALTQDHPDRGVKTTVVRTTLEGLVAKSQAQRTKQGSSVFYTATADSESAAAEPQQEKVAG